MTRESGFSFLGLLVLVFLVSAFLYWYWSPILPLRLPVPSTDATDIGADTTVTNSTASAPLVQPAPTAQPTATSLPMLAPYCPPGQPARFVLGFEQLSARLGDVMGRPLECEHVNPDNGDTLQQTTTGLAVYYKQTGTLEFTDGWRHWALQGPDLVAWEGDTPPGTPSPERAGSSAPPDTGTEAESVRVTGTDGVGVVLRFAPSEHSRMPAGLAEGATAEVLERSNGYLHVRSRDGREGWVPEQYVEPVE